MKKSLITLTLLALLTGCSSEHYSESDPASWGNFRCTAKDSAGAASIGWAVTESAAQKSALAKCQDKSSDPKSCQIEGCANDAA